MAQYGADVLLADRPCVVAQTAVDLANESKPVTGAREGRIGNEKKESAVRNNNAVMDQQQLADATPLEVELRVLGGKSKPAIVLDQSNDLVEICASLDLAGLKAT